MVQMLEGRGDGRRTWLSVDHTDALMPSYSRVVTDEAVLETRGAKRERRSRRISWARGTARALGANRDGTFDIVATTRRRFNKDPAEMAKKVHTAACRRRGAGRQRGGD